MPTATQLYERQLKTSVSCHETQRYSEDGKHFPKTERGEEVEEEAAAGEQRDQDHKPLS